MYFNNLHFVIIYNSKYDQSHLESVNYHISIKYSLDF